MARRKHVTTKRKYGSQKISVTNNTYGERRIYGVEVDGREFKFGRQNAFEISDPHLAQAIEDKYGRGGNDEVVVSRHVPRMSSSTFRVKLPKGYKREWKGDNKDG